MTSNARRTGLLAAASMVSLAFAASAQAKDESRFGGGVDLRTDNPAVGLDLADISPFQSSYQGFSTVHSVRPDQVVDEPAVVPRNDLSPNALPPAGILDPTDITGVGQMVINNIPGSPGASLGTCTGTLINPRTVIFAAHCVNTRAASAYGSNTGGTPISFGFKQNNLPALFDWLGFNDPSKIFQTNVDSAIYNVENVWYDPRSVVPEGNFLQADVAIATLDTPAFDIPTWAMLFTPLDQQEHVTVTGYGSTGNGIVGSNTSGNWRRRIAENYVSFLGSLADRNVFLFGSASGGLPQNLYMSSFSDPNPAYNTATGKYDFGLFGPNDVALPREGITGPGDSGGPLILDQKYDIPLVIGVLSGGSRFFAGQPFGSYGTHSFYQPLHAFWDLIVANNPYVYATNKAGIGDWTDSRHWIQAMDPSYQIVINGELVNGLPSAPGEGISGEGAKFGDVCFLDECQDFTDPGEPTVGGDAYFVEGGPGSRNFVPNNIVANPGQGVRPRYFDVTLSAAGLTRLRDANITIDRLTVDGPTTLNITKTGTLNVLGDFTQLVGWTHIDGTLSANEAFLMTGVLAGSGTLRTPFFTSAAGLIAPGSTGSTGTLTIDGNATLASGTTLFIDLNRNGSDLLAVTGTLSLSDPTDAGSKGASLVVSSLVGSQPRYRQTFTIATAGGGIEGRFGTVGSFLGVLKPELSYSANTVTATMQAGSFLDLLRGASVTAKAFGKALDQLRAGSYNALGNFYGMVDLMDGNSLAMTFDGLAPTLGTDTNSLQRRQSNVLSFAVADRLSVMGGASGQMAVMGEPGTIRNGLAALGTGQPDVRMGIADLAPKGGSSIQLPEGVAGFVSGGTFGGNVDGASNLADGGQYGSYFGMGLERSVSQKASVGIAVGYADGRELTSSGTSRAATSQLAAYGSYKLGGNAYLGGMASMENVEIDTQRAGFDGGTDQRLYGASTMTRYAANAEIGVNLPLGKGMTLTPRAQLGYDLTNLGGYTEQGSQVALRIDGLNTESLSARSGFKLAGSHTTMSGWTVTPQLNADYVRRVGGSDDMTVRFAAADDIGILLPLDQGDTSWAEIRGGLSVARGNLSFGAGFETAIDRQAFRNDRAMVEFGYRF